MKPSNINKLKSAIIILLTLSLLSCLLIPWLPLHTLLALYAAFNFILFNSIFVFVITRHLHLRTSPHLSSTKWHPQSDSSSYSTSTSTQPIKPMDYYLIVLGSGGHTREMLMMMDDGFSNFRPDTHRRYILSSGDSTSAHHLRNYEDGLTHLCAQRSHSPGTHDFRIVTRARKVHQSIYTAPLTALVSLYDILCALLLSPPAGRPTFPDLVMSNGPATGFLTGLAVHLLKIFYIVPEDRCYFVYIESWARISTLSLTGKLFYYTGIANQFAVQHQEVAARYRVPNAGPLVFNSRRDESDDVR